MVPNGWSEYRFEQIVSRTQLGTTERHKGDSCESPIPLLKMGNLNWGGISLKGVETLPMFKVDESLMLRYGDFLFNTRNTPDLVGKSAVWRSELPQATFDNNINRIDFIESIYPFYMEAYLNHGRGKAIVNSLPAGSTSVAAIYWKDLKNIKLVLPPLGEQRKIAKILATWDKAIATTEKLIAASQQQKKALMQQLLTGKKRLTNPETGQPFDGDWEEVRLGNVSKPQQWPTISSKELLANGYPVYGANGHIGYYSEFNHEFETVAVTCRGSTCGEVSLVPAKSYITGNAMCLDEIDEHLHSYKFMFYALSYRGFKDVISGSAQPQIVGKAIKAVKLSFPSLPEQLKIVAVLTATDKEIEVQQAKLTHLKQEKKALMQQLLTGKRRVTIDEQEVA